MAGRLGARRYTTLACRAAQSEARLSLTALADLLEELADDLPALLPTPQRPLPQPGSARAPRNPPYGHHSAGAPVARRPAAADGCSRGVVSGADANAPAPAQR